MSDDLITTKDASTLLGRSVATINRWATEGRSDRPQPALTLPGETGARLYRRADVEAYRDAEIAKAVAAGACPHCTTAAVQEWHGKDTCPQLEAAS